MRNFRFFFILFSFFLLSGCISFKAQQVPLTLERPKECQAFLTALDQEVVKAGVRDAANYSVPGFPYLRTNRFLARLKEDIHSEEIREQWSRWMRTLDLEARKKEVSNLPDIFLSSLSSKNRSKLHQQAESCSERLFQHDKSRPDFNETLIPLVAVPDEYSLAMRAFGLYPLIAIPVAITTQMSRNKVKSWYKSSLEDLPVDGLLTAYSPAESSFLSDDELKAIIAENSGDVPLPDQHVAKKLVQHFAPVFIQDVSAPYDRIGHVMWNENCPDVDPTKPTVYYYFSNAFLKRKPILQINYVIWYSERAGKRSPSIERGHLDGLTLRVSLDEKGKPFMVDIVNDCGCYHLFAPEKGRVAQILSKPLRFDPFVPQWLPDIPPDQRIGVRLNSGWHQVQRLIAAKEFPNPVLYELMPYDFLEALPRERNQSESIFNSKGIAKCSERIERFILFSMGIPKIGSMRQRGHHAIELIGRSQFDDPDLFDQSFIFK